MTEQQIERCRKCGSPKRASGNTGTITQWISVCHCDELSIGSAETGINVCSTCGKRVTTGAGASLTQWVFGGNRCSCNQPGARGDKKPIDKRHSHVTASDATQETIHEEIELALDPDNFPTERYKPLSEIGRGAAGIVYICRDRLLGKKVAIKCLRSITGDQLMGFQKEAKATSQLQHAAIVEVMDFGCTTSGAPYMVMEYVGGMSLEEYVKSSGPLPLALAVRIFGQVAQGMAHAHQRGVFHRDLKSSNILIAGLKTGDPSAKIIDFGVAATKQIRNDDSDGVAAQGKTIVGTPAYMAPDQALGHSYSERSEIYSLGCALFESLTGRPPFEGETALEVIGKHAHQTAPLLSEVRSECDFGDDLESIVAKCLSKKPDDRFPSMDQLKIALENASHTLPRTELDETIAGIASVKQEYTDQHSIAPKKHDGTRFNTTIGIIVFSSIVLVSSLMYLMLLPSEQTYSGQSRHKKKKVLAKRFTKDDPRVDNMLISDDNFAAQEINRQMTLTRGLAQDDYLACSPSSVEELDTLLKQHPKAFHLRVYNNTVNEAMTDLIVKTKRLTQVRLESVKINEQSQTRLASIARLDSLRLIKVALSKGALQQLKHLDKLRDLQLTECGIKDEDLKYVVLAKNVTILKVDKNGPFTADGVKVLASLKLESLSISDSGIKGPALKGFSSMNRLHSLTLTNCGPFTKSDLKHLLSVKRLTKLSIGNTGIDDSCLMITAKMPELNGLDVSDNKKITIGGLQHLSGRRDLTVIVGGTSIQNVNLARLSNELGGLKLQSKQSNPNRMEDFYTML